MDASSPSDRLHSPGFTGSHPAGLLAAGILAGPAYVVTSFIEVIFRPGFDVTRHSLSLLSNGEGGWLHSGMMLVAGSLMVAGAIGIRRVLRAGQGRTWGPILIGIFGASFIAAGLMIPDPALGFPPGTPPGPPAVVTWQSMGHLVAGSIGFLSLIAAAFILARRFRADGDKPWAIYSAATGVIVLAAVIGISSGNQVPVMNVAFTTSGVIAWIWTTTLCAHLRAQRWTNEPA